MRRLVVAALLASCGFGCHHPAPAQKGLPPPICTAGSSWTSGSQAFQDATTAWGLDVLDPEGQRISVADIDNDGWPDLIVRAIGTVPDQGPTGGPRSIWLLRNTGHHAFEDVTYSSGFAQTRQTHSPAIGRPGDVVVFADVDNDGDLDACQGTDTFDMTKSLGETSEIMINDGTGHFSLGPAGSDVRRNKHVDIPGGASFVDYDHDGNIDLWVPQYSEDTSTSVTPIQNLLYRGDGQGNFTDTVIDAGILTKDWSNLDNVNNGLAHTRSWSALACDLNNDGFPELLAASYGRSPNQLWQAQPADAGTTFSNHSVASGYAFDDDFHWEDNQFAECYCEETPTDPECDGGLPTPQISCTPPLNWDPSTDTEKFRLGGNSGTTLCADLANDGQFDLVTTEIKHWWAGESSDEAEVMVNNGGPDITFSRPGRASMGIVVPHDSVDWDEGIITAATFDFDNDGWPDLYLGATDYPGNRGLLFHQKSRLQFEPVPIDEGIDQHRSHGVVVADFDRDGDLDVIVGHSPARCDQASYPDTDTPCYPKFNIRLFENVLGQKGNWIQLKLEGAAGTNRSAIGALITVEAGGVTQAKQVDGGHGHFGMEDDLVQHFGLGPACEAKVTIRWPNAQQETQTFTVPSGYRFAVKEGTDPVVIPVPR
jgi:hypothetical protein